MAQRATLQIGDSRLKANNLFVDNFADTKIAQVVRDLIDTMHAGDLIGMAAPQIGENFKIFVTEPRKTEARPADQTDAQRVYINPQIVHSSGEKVIIYEGCGSVLSGNLFGPVLRPREITIEAFDLNQKKFRLRCDGILARVIQHEYDHLSGIEFTEKIADYKKLMAREFYLRDIKNSPEQIQASLITVREVAEG
jgi:peptide deformylase